MTTTTFDPSVLAFPAETPVTVSMPQTQPVTRLDVSRIAKALEACEKVDRDQWIKLAHALKWECEGRSEPEQSLIYFLYETWSHRVDPDRDRREPLRKRWDEFHPTGDVTLGTLFHLAKQPTATKAADGRETRFNTLGIKEFLSKNYGGRFLIECFLYADQVCCFGGPSKCLKTSLLLDMGISLATGTPFLGQKSERSRVLFMSGESGGATLQEKVKEIIKSKGEPEEGYFYFSDVVPRLDKMIDDVEKELDETRAEVLIIDPLYLAIDFSDSSNVGSMGPQIAGVAAVCAKRGVTLVLAHHTTKGASKKRESLELEDMSCAGISESFRQFIIVSRRASYEHGSGKHELFLTVSGSRGHGGSYYLDVDEGEFTARKWECTLRSTSEAREAQTDDRYATLVAKVKAFFASDNTPAAKTKISTQINVHARDIDDLIQRMIDDGIILRVAGKVSRYQLKT